MKSGRVKLVCEKCKAEFSTHSSNRTLCHECKPKCMEWHYFNQPAPAPRELVGAVPTEQKQEVPA